MFKKIKNKFITDVQFYKNIINCKKKVLSLELKKC